MKNNRTMYDIVTAPQFATEPYLYIGKVSEMTGASCKAIRLYESRGLIPKPQRRGAYRIYSERDIFLIHMIKHVQTVGFGLKEVKELVDATIDGARFPLELANDIFERKRTALQGQINELQQVEQRLVSLKGEMNRIFGG
jgi:DNA-binding transcriptional MerR regulator